MKSITFLFILLVSGFSGAMAQETYDPKQSIQSNSRLQLPDIQVIPIMDSQSQRVYELYIKLPESYTSDEHTNYPVLYVTDALWHIEILSGSIGYLSNNMILVGISWQKGERPEISRFRDYTLLEGMHPDYQSGGAAEHLDFIRNDVIDYIEKNFRADPNKRSYFGYSLGGTFGTYILWTEPRTFKNYILGSPETMLDDSFVYEHIKMGGMANNLTEINVFISYGALEKERLIQHVNGLVSSLKAYNTAGAIQLNCIKNSDHSTAFPMMAVQSMYWLTNLIKD